MGSQIKCGQSIGACDYSINPYERKAANRTGKKT